MVRTSLRIVMVAALMGTGWMAGRAQTTEPNFEIVVEAPAGETTIRCVRGCELSWVERGRTPTAETMPTFRFDCSSPSGRCSSHRVGGWLKP
jgi:hypothetical protein